MSRLNTIASLLKKDSATGALVKKALALSELNTLLKQHLPAKFAEHITLSTIKDQTIFLQSDSAAWAAQLRYITPEFVESLNTVEEFQNILNIQVKVSPESLPAGRQRKPLTLSRASADAINRYSSSLTNNKTREAFKRIAKKLKE
jgi:hypothetical protein